jgi:hydrophobic/amphiphilic exporter-1 (mainly G- bacteria), HAE1 family
MVRTEIYANRSVEEDIKEEIEKRIPGVSYSLIEDVQGRGRSGVHHGTAVWPELNILYILYGTEQEAFLIDEAVREVKKAFPREGIKVFQYEVNALVRERKAE